MKVYRLSLTFVILLTLSLGAGCASQRRVEITSQPSGAEVRNTRDEVVGVTPLTLEKEKVDTVTDQGRLRFSVRADGFQPRTFIVEPLGQDKLDVKLLPQNEEGFSRDVLPDYTAKANEMTREILRIQGLLVVRKNGEAAQSVAQFQKKYPSIAAGFVMEANLALAKGDRRTARGALERARQLDPNDLVAARMLSLLQGSGGIKR